MTLRPTLLRLGALCALVVLSAAVALLVPRTAHVNPDPNHLHVDFAVWINGKRWDFSQEKYMSGKPDEARIQHPFIERASAHGGHDEGETIVERALVHLHDGNASVIHAHKQGLTLRYFLASLGWQITNTCIETDTHERFCAGAGDARWRMFVNGKEEQLNPYHELKDTERILLTYGSKKEEIFSQITSLTDDACLYSQTCPERGDPPSENCVADPTVPCVE